MPRVIVRLAAPGDAHALWTWRNDEHTRAMSLDPGAIAWADHAAWFERALADPRRTIYVGVFADGERVGMCRFDADAADAPASVSLNLRPEMRGRRLALPLLAAAVERYRQTHAAALRAVIRADNAASIRCFEQCGFVRTGAEHAILTYELAPAREDV